MKKSIKYLLLLLIFLSNYSCKRQGKSISRELQGRVSVSIVPIEYTQISETIETSGLVKSDEEVSLSFKTGGIIQKIYVEEGQHIQKDQLLGSLDLTEIEAQVLLIQANLEKIQRDLTRVKTLYTDSAATLEQVQNLTTAFSIAKENLKVAQFNLTYSKIRSPFSGIVAKKWKNEGELIAMGTPLLTIFKTNNNNWNIKAGITDKDRSRIAFNNKAMICLDVFPDHLLIGKINKIAEMPDPMTGLYSVEIKLEPTNVQLASGYFASVSILPSATQRLSVIPIEAITEGVGKKAFVYVADKSSETAIKKEILISYFDDSKVYVISGLVEGDNVIVQGVSYLENGSKINIGN